MLKTVSSITNAIGALNFKGTWDANANSPALASSVGTKGDYYVVGTAGSTNLNGISNWGVGDLATFNGSVWQRVEGGADLNGVNLSVSGTSTLSGLTASTALALNASKEIVSVTNTGTGNNVLATSPSVTTPTLIGDVQMSTGNLVVGTSGKGIDFSITSSGTGTMTSELFADYEEGTWTPTISYSTSNTGLTFTSSGNYVKSGKIVVVTVRFDITNIGSASGNMAITGLPFTSLTGTPNTGSGAVGFYSGVTSGGVPTWFLGNNGTVLDMLRTISVGVNSMTATDTPTNAAMRFTVTYISA